MCIENSVPVPYTDRCGRGKHGVVYSNGLNMAAAFDPCLFFFNFINNLRLSTHPRRRFPSKRWKK